MANRSVRDPGMDYLSSHFKLVFHLSPRRSASTAALVVSVIRVKLFRTFIAKIKCIKVRALVEQEQQRVAVVDPETRILFLFARCRPTQPRCGL